VLAVYRNQTRIRLLLLGAVGVFVVASTASAQTLSAGAPADTFNLSNFASGLNQITDFRFLPDGRVVITRKTGEVMVRATDGTVVQAGSFPVDTESEKGLLGVELHPQFGQGSNRTLFFYYSRADGSGGTDDNRHRVVSMTLADTNQLTGSETVLLQNLRGPANHDGGGLAIGPDGKLYVGVGDTGCNSGVPPGGSITNYIATCLTTANGKILRINLDGSIPTDNPLVGTSVRACDGTSCTGAQPDPSLLTGVPRTEIWSWGFRNPFRFSFDPQTGSLWVGDVGEVTYEEVDLVTKGQHYGWPYREGAFGYPVTTCATLGANGSGSNCVEPKYFCQHGSSPPAGIDGDCQSITGGVFLDSATWPAAFRGLYFFGDNANGRVWTLTPSANRDGFVTGSRTPFGTGFGTPVRFIVGPDGDLYVANESANTIVVIRPKSPADAGPPDGGPPDAGQPDGGAPDAGPADGGTLDPGASVSGGCGCSSTGNATSAVAMVTLALLAVVGRRRRDARREDADR
jgi:MYXO-CTERM domain-containing protein